MKRFKALSVVLAATMLMSVAACNDSGDTKEKTSATTEVSEETTKETEAEATSAEVTIEETEESEEELSSEESEETVIETIDRLEEFTELRNFAETLHEDGDTKLYGYYNQTLYSDAPVFLTVYDGEVSYYEYDGTAVVKNESGQFRYIEPETNLIPYDVFAELPGPFDYLGIAYSDVDLTDGQYGGTLIGFSEDGKYLYACMGPMLKVSNLTSEQCMNLEVGDKVVVSLWGDCEVTDIFADDPSCLRFTLRDLDAEVEPEMDDICGYILVDLDEDGNPVNTRIWDAFGYNYFTDFSVVKLSITEDTVIKPNSYETLEGDFLTYLDTKAADEDSGLIKNEGFGYYYLDNNISGIGRETCIVENGELKVLVLFAFS